MTHFSTLKKSFTSLIIKRRNIETVLSFQTVYDTWLYVNRDALDLRFCWILIYAFFLWTHFSTLKQRFMTFNMKCRNIGTVLSFLMVYRTCLYVNRNAREMRLCLILIYMFFLLTHFSTLKKSFTTLIMKCRNIETVLSFQTVYGTCLYVNKIDREMQFS